MISALHIRNVGIIDDITIDLNDGLNILTGETGAGKTLIIDSLQIISGGRFSKEMIRKGEEFSFVEVSIYLPEHEQSIDGNIIISREIYLNGRNTCKINGRLVSVTELRSFMKDILDIHGQNENQTLLDVSSHIKYIDEFASKDISKVKTEYGLLYEKYNEIKQEINKNFGDDKEKQRELDLLKYQKNEIEEAKLKENEEEELEDIRNKMLNSEKIVSNLSEAEEQINNIAIDAISLAVRALEKIENIDTKYENSLNTLKGIYYDIQELSRDIEGYSEETYFDEDERNRVEERLDLIYTLKRKYGNSIKEILKYNLEINERIEKIENSEEYVNKLKQDLKEIKLKMSKIAKDMNKIREKYANILSEKVNKELKDLEMKNAKFFIHIEYDENGKFTQNGLDKIEFMISTNIGEDEKPLAKIASGGEMSRIMLGIKNVLADVDRVSTMVFDEIDTGISGMAANATSEKLKSISKKHQVLCVTHLANIAAKGDYNYYISKEASENRTKTSIKRLSEEETIKEIARIASGNIDEISLEHAKNLRKTA
ncbi:MAG: DNA repair protein RecN [Clostridia bacterium]|nr:DNA repair protein RecN [Clostridia bacterium]